MATHEMIETATGLATYTADLTHSQVGFRVRHLGFSKVSGLFRDYDVTVEIDPSNLGTLKARAEIDVASIDTGNNDRDNHLRSADFFDAESQPKLTFESTRVTDVDGNSFELEGDLTMRGVTQRVTLRGEYLGEARDPWGGERVAFEAKTKVNRKDYGLTWNQVLETGGLLVAEDVEIILEIQAVKQA